MPSTSCRNHGNPRLKKCFSELYAYLWACAYVSVCCVFVIVYPSSWTLLAYPQWDSRWAEACYSVTCAGFEATGCLGEGWQSLQPFLFPSVTFSVCFITIPRSFTFKKMCVLDLIWFLINVTAWLSKKTSFLNHFPSITNPWIHSRSVSCAPLTLHPCAASLKTNYNLIMWQDLSFLFNLSNNLLSWKF